MDNVKSNIKINDNDFKIEWFSGTGKGGQKRNKVKTSCKVTYLPAGLIETRQGRSRNSNLLDAKTALIKRINNDINYNIESQQAKIAKNQKGSGMRGDKIRTYRFQDNIVINHNTNEKFKLKSIMNGDFDILWR